MRTIEFYQDLNRSNKYQQVECAPKRESSTLAEMRVYFNAAHTIAIITIIFFFPLLFGAQTDPSVNYRRPNFAIHFKSKLISDKSFANFTLPFFARRCCFHCRCRLCAVCSSSFICSVRNEKICFSHGTFFGRNDNKRCEAREKQERNLHIFDFEREAQLSGSVRRVIFLSRCCSPDRRRERRRKSGSKKHTV